MGFADLGDNKKSPGSEEAMRHECFFTDRGRGFNNSGSGRITDEYSTTPSLRASKRCVPGRAAS